MQTCQNCKQQFDITPEDSAFYAKIQVPAPTFPPDRPDIVYCEECYLAEVA